METQTMVQRPSTFFFMKKPYTNKILGVRLEGLFWAGIKWDVADKWYGFGLWGLGLWMLHTMPARRLQFLYIFGYFQPIYLDSQQSLAIQSHVFSTWTAIV
jgi:hypothetical protein